MTTTPVLEVKGLKKHFPVTQGFLLKKVVGWVQAVDGVDFSIPQGDTLALSHRDGRAVSVETRARYTVNKSLAIRESLLAGAGIGLAPDWLVGDLLEHGRLRRVLPAWQASPHRLSVLYPPRRYQPLRARLFIEFATARLGRHSTPRA